jgi:hypothetical protein
MTEKEQEKHTFTLEQVSQHIDIMKRVLNKTEKEVNGDRKLQSVIHTAVKGRRNA